MKKNRKLKSLGCFIVLFLLLAVLAIQTCDQWAQNRKHEEYHSEVVQW